MGSIKGTIFFARPYLEVFCSLPLWATIFVRANDRPLGFLIQAIVGFLCAFGKVAASVAGLILKALRIVDEISPLRTRNAGSFLAL